MLDSRVFFLLIASTSFCCSLRAGDVIGSGTGFVVAADGHILTNAHVVTGCSKVEARAGERRLPAQIVAVDSQNDLALLRVQDKLQAVLPLRATRVQLGETVVVFGYPLRGIVSDSLNMTAGNVSALAGFGDDARYLQFTAPVQHGNSGGPLVDGSGNVVGVVTSKLSPIWSAKMLDVPQNVNFGLKTSVIREFLETRSVEYTVGTPSAPIAITDLPPKVSAAVFAVDCIAGGEAHEIHGRPQSTAIEWRRGVLIAG